MSNSPENSRSSLKVNNSFIAEWHPKYDEIESDEPDYKYLVVQVKNELAKNGTISVEVFTQILNWKSARVKGKIKWHEFEIYENAIRDACIAEADKKLAILCGLYGIGAPVGSTILHFMYPNDFPIIDIRTAESLHHSGYLNSSKTDLSRFAAFRTELLKIANGCNPFSLREIDRALFAYHKIKLFPGSLNRSPKESRVIAQVPKKQSCEIIGTSIVNSSGHTPSNTNLSVPEKVRLICQELAVEGEIIKRGDILRMAKKRGINENSVLPADYCDNTGTGKWSRHSFLHSVGPGKYILR